MRSVGLLFIVLTLAARVPAQDNAPYKLEINTALVSVDVGVFDRSEKPVTDLTKEDFRVYEDGVLQQIRSFTAPSSPYHILLLIDHSGSMNHYWASLLKGLTSFMKTLRPQDQVAVASFDEKVELALPWQSAQAGSAAKLRIMPDGDYTEIWYSMDWAIQELNAFNGRRGVIVFTDGRDSGNAFDAVMKHAVDSGIPHYFVGVTDENTEGAGRMTAFARATGGQAYFPKGASDLPPLYTAIARDLGTSYTIAYSPSIPPGNKKLRHIEVRPVDNAAFHVIQSRSSYDAK
jgi:VWFA-related protein